VTPLPSPAVIQEVVAPGYTFQGRTLRLPVVLLRLETPESLPDSETLQTTDEGPALVESAAPSSAASEARPEVPPAAAGPADDAGRAVGKSAGEAGAGDFPEADPTPEAAVAAPGELKVPTAEDAPWHNEEAPAEPPLRPPQEPEEPAASAIPKPASHRSKSARSRNRRPVTGELFPRDESASMTDQRMREEEDESKPF
jgi:hypothetical protein